MKTLFSALFILIALLSCRLHAQSGTYTFQKMDTTTFGPLYYTYYLTQKDSKAKDTVYVLYERNKYGDTCKGYETLIPGKEYQFDLEKVYMLKSQTISVPLKGGGLIIHSDDPNIPDKCYGILYSSTNLCGPMYLRKE